ncbi:MAG: DUF2934 domain-containing protein [Acidobacteria bacterium]|nr:DUF2934 domain-containing protein [Acidobacteriota bacterium]
MTLTLILTGTLLTLGLSVLVVIVIRSKPRKAEEGERGEILKQLLALSEAEASTLPVAVRNRPLPFPAQLASDCPPQSTKRASARRRKASSYIAKSPVLIKKDVEVEEQIRRRAYELYQQRGGVEGRATDDWLRAKEEVLRSTGKASKSPS